MNSKLVQILMALMVVSIVYTSWTVATLRADLKKLSYTQAGNHCPSVDLQAMNAPLLQIQTNQVSMTGSLSYAELLLEGLTRKAGLPLEQARKAFEARAAGVPAGWTWLAPWEGAPADQLE